MKHLCVRSHEGWPTGTASCFAPLVTIHPLHAPRSFAAGVKHLVFPRGLPPCTATLPVALLSVSSHTLLPLPTSHPTPFLTGVKHLVFPEGNRRDWDELTDVSSFCLLLSSCVVGSRRTPRTGMSRPM